MDLRGSNDNAASLQQTFAPVEEWNLDGSEIARAKPGKARPRGALSVQVKPAWSLGACYPGNQVSTTSGG